jgi:uracil-DNA glycosylase
VTALSKLKAEVAECQACDLWKNATQTVFGEGKSTSTVMFVGEQPGDREDLQGRPFVGPAGALLDKALEEAGIDRAKVYVTNVVKQKIWTAIPVVPSPRLRGEGGASAPGEGRMLPRVAPLTRPSGTLSPLRGARDLKSIQRRRLGRSPLLVIVLRT